MLFKQIRKYTKETSSNIFIENKVVTIIIIIVGCPLTIVKF